MPTTHDDAATMADGSSLTNRRRWLIIAVAGAFALFSALAHVARPRATPYRNQFMQATSLDDATLKRIRKRASLNAFDAEYDKHGTRLFRRWNDAWTLNGTVSENINQLDREQFWLRNVPSPPPPYSPNGGKSSELFIRGYGSRVWRKVSQEELNGRGDGT